MLHPILTRYCLHQVNILRDIFLLGVGGLDILQNRCKYDLQVLPTVMMTDVILFN